MRTIRLLSFGMLGTIGLAAVLTGAAATQPETLTLADLVNRPDRWPATVTLPHDFRFNDGFTVHQGDPARVGLFDGTRVGLIAAGNHRFAAAPADVGLLDAANRAWAALTPAQRAVDPESLAADPSLWPVQVSTTSPITCQWGRLAEGTVVGLVSVTSHGPDVAWPNSPNRLNLNFGSTDVIARARHLALVAPAQRPSRIAAALQAIMVDADGRPYRDDHLGDKQFFALYFGASWCAPCHAFSPALVKYLDDALPKHPELAAVFLSDDKALPPMFAYMKQERMPIPAVPPQAVSQSTLLTTYASQLIPQLVIVDRFGRVLATSDDNHGNRIDPEETLGALTKLLAGQSAM